jgi:hypothetical protein
MQWPGRIDWYIWSEEKGTLTCGKRTHPFVPLDDLFVFGEWRVACYQVVLQLRHYRRDASKDATIRGTRGHCFGKWSHLIIMTIQWW